MTEDELTAMDRAIFRMRAKANATASEVEREVYNAAADRQQQKRDELQRKMKGESS